MLLYYSSLSRYECPRRGFKVGTHIVGALPNITHHQKRMSLEFESILHVRSPRILLTSRMALIA